MKLIKRIQSLIIICSVILGLFPAVVNAEETSSSFVYLGQDTKTHNQWEGKYGSDGYVLLGYLYREINGENSLKELSRPYVPLNSYDLIGGNAIKSLKVTNSDGLLSVNGNVGGNSIAMPAEKTSDGYQVSAIAFANGETGDPMHSGMCKFEFTLNDNEEKIFSVYGHENPTGSVVYEFMDAATKKVIYSKKFNKQPAANGNYVSFRVKGSFVLRILTDGRQNTVSSFFFDSVKENNTSLAVALDKQENNVTVAIDDSKEADRYYLIRSDGETTKQLCQLEGGEKAYKDFLTNGNTKYDYILYKYGIDGFSKSRTFTYVTPKTAEIAIELSGIDKDVYTAGDKVVLKANVKAGTVPVADATVKFMLDGSFVDYGYMDAFIGEAKTDISGNAVFEYPLDVADTFKIYAVAEQNYTAGFSKGVSEKKEFTVKLKPYEDKPFILKMSDAIKYDELISVTGEGFSENVEVKAYKFEGNENTPAEPPENAFNLEVVQRDELNSQFLTVKMPKTTPAGLYSIWVKNEYGWSKPYTLNESRINFISEYEVRPGMSIQISGRNLDLRQINFENHSTAIRLKDENGNTYVQEVTKVTPYSVTFCVNNSTPLGTYEVEVTNNGGLSWTGTESGQTLTVLEPCDDPIGLGLSWVADFKWDKRFNVLDYGANNRDKQNDFEAFEKAINAAHDAGGGVVYIPDGTYYYDKTLPLYAGVVLLGQSTDGTIIYYNGADGNHIAESTGDGQTIGLYGMAYFTIKVPDDTYHPTGIWHGNAWSSAYDQKKRTATRIFMKGMNIELNIYKDNKKQFSRAEIDTIMKERYTVQDCYVRMACGMPCVYINEYVYYNNSEFNFANGYLFSGARYTFETNMHIEHETEYPSELIDEQNTHGYFGRGYIHWENCNINGLGHWGDSECFCSETPNAQFGFGKVLSSTDDKIYTYSLGPAIGDSTLSYVQTVRNSYLAVCIMGGRGVGQLRAVKSFDPEGRWFEVDKPWDIQPDSSSIFTLVCPNDRTTVYKSEINDGGTVCSFYGVGYDCVADSIIGHNVTGLNTHNTWVESANRLSFGYFLAYRNCEMSGSMQAIFDRHKGEMGVYLTNFRSEGNGKFAGIVGYAQELRNIKVVCDPNGRLYSPEGAINYNLTKQPTDDKKGDISNIIIENAYAENAKYGISFGGPVGNGIVVRNVETANISSGIDVNVPKGTENYIYIEDGPTSDGDTLEYKNMISSQTGSSDVTFNDLGGFEWAADEINAAYKKGITNGTGFGIFSPGKTVSRAEFLGFVVKAAGFDKVAYKNNFKDVTENMWYADYVQTAYTNALIDDSMISDRKINPEKPITREEMACVIARAVMNREHSLNITAENAGFSDMSEISEKYVKYINIAKKYGIIRGDENNCFNPKSNANRAEAVLTVNRFYDCFNNAEDK